MDNRLSNEQKLVVELSTFGYPIDVEKLHNKYNFSEIDWIKLYATSKTKGTVGLLINNLEVTGLINQLDERIVKAFRKIAADTRDQYEKYIKEAHSIANFMNEKEFRIVFLKGIALTQTVYKEHPSSRTFGDMDIVALPQQCDTIHSYLRSDLGFICRDDLNRQRLFKHIFQHYSVLEKDDFYYIDLHHRFNLGFQKDRIDVEKFIENAVSIESNGYKLNIPNTEDLLISLCHHLHRSEALFPTYSLKGHADTFNLIYKYSDQINWNLFIKRVKDQNLHFAITYSLFHTNFLYKDVMGLEIVPKYVLDELMPEDFYAEKDVIRSQELLTDKIIGYWDQDTYLGRLFADLDRLYKKVREQFHHSTVKQNWMQLASEFGFDLKQEYLPRDPVQKNGDRFKNEVEMFGNMVKEMKSE